MVTFKQSLILLVSIITVLAVIAIVTGLSPLYWPRPTTSSHESNITTVVHPRAMNLSDVKTDLISTLKVVTKKSLELTTPTMNTVSQTTTHEIVPNTTRLQ